MLAPEVETRPWAEQLAVDDASYRTQLAHLFDRSPFYREKLAAAGFASARAAGGLAGIAQLPLTEKRELRATCTPENPVGAHLCATRSELVRIYSTSGTTGTPSYVPLTAGDLDNWVTASARSYAASGRRSCTASVRRSVFPVPTGMWQRPIRSKAASAAPATNGPALYVLTMRWPAAIPDAA